MPALADLRGRGIELGYAENTGPNIAVPSGGATTTAITGCALTFATTDRPVLIRAFIPAVSMTSLAGAYIAGIEENSVVLAQANSPQAYAAARAVGALMVQHRVAAGVASKTYQLTAYGSGSACTVVLTAAARAWIQATEV